MEIRDLPAKSNPKGGSPRTPSPIPVREMNENGKKGIINVNTGISVGVVGILIVGIWTILNAITSAKNESNSAIASMRQELNGRFDKVELRVSTLESQKNNWSAVQMFQWSVHLKELNSKESLTKDGLRVPEPEIPK